MDNINTINHFMAGIAPAGDVGKGTKGAEGQRLILCVFKYRLPVAGAAAFAPGVKAQFLFDIAQPVGNHVDTAQMVLQQVVGGLLDEAVVLIADGFYGVAQLAFVLALAVAVVDNFNY